MSDRILYIDPGTGSMLFSLFMALATTAVFVGRELFIRLKFVLSGGRAKKSDSDRIPFVIYSDHKRYWNVFKPVCDEFERRGVDAVFYTQSPDDPALSEPYKHVRAEFIGEGNKGFAKLNFLKADVVLSTTPGLDVYQWKRSRDVRWYVHILHAVDDPASYRMFGIDSYDAVLLSGKYQEEQVRFLEEARGLPSKQLAIVGCTYMDTMLGRVRASAKKDGTPLTVLLAPSWGKNGILAKYGGRILDALIATGFKIVVRPHPQTLLTEKDVITPLVEAYKDTDSFSWNYDNDNFAALSSADILITDFSGIIFDYALVFDRPLIYADTSFDVAPYDAAWLSEPMWKFQVLPSIGVRLDESQFGELKSVIEQAARDEALREGRRRAREVAWENVGRSAEFTVDFILNKRESLVCRQ